MRGITFIGCLMALLATGTLFAQDQVELKGILLDETLRPAEGVVVYVDVYAEYATTDSSGHFTLHLLKGREETLYFRGQNIEPFQETVNLRGDSSLTFYGLVQVTKLGPVTIHGEKDAFGIRQLHDVEDGGIYEGKKTEVINVDKLVGNKPGNNARQALSKIPSLNIWESDAAGIQLDIGGRGLSPRRTTNFNTRQDGYDISADALGYPESYYTPPLLAVQQIEMVRGAGALQYGSQFGGLLNFKMKRGIQDRPFQFESINTYGANNFVNSFNSFHGQKGKVNYYSYLQFKRGDGWRDNTAFDQYSGYASVKYQASEDFKVTFDFTHMYYLTQQGGGLTDELFEQDPTFSNRARNWFRVTWNLPAIILEYYVTPEVKLYSRTFGLVASRTSLGVLNTPNEEDPMGPRDLIDGQFRNIGNETRVVVPFGKKDSLENTLLVGARIFRGKTRFSQFYGSAGSGADFSLVDTIELDRSSSDFHFPNVNLAAFGESIIRLNKTLSLIPGVRYEYINTQSEGVLTTTVKTSSFGDFVLQETNDTTSQERHIFLFGLGLSKKFNDTYELYANATRNYRAINFTDVRIQTKTQLVDTLIKDEQGFSFDLGIRKLNFKPFYLETGVFFLLYQDRIGEIIDDGLRIRTNVGSAHIFGAELFFELDVLQALKKKSDHKLTCFINGSVNKGQYVKINQRALTGVRQGNRVEDVPEYNVKIGMSYGVGRFKTSLQGSFVGDQYSDAANTEIPFQGVYGPIPAFAVVDFSAKFDLTENWYVSTSINNLLDRSYFTRRATAYPGPGIIPALGRIWNLSLGLKL